MPNDQHTGTVPCPYNTDLIGCLCPINTFLSEDGLICGPIPPKGVKTGVEGMILERLEILPGFWRTDTMSEDVRPCPVEEACVGLNQSTIAVGGTVNFCRTGHEGPYCNLCSDGFC